MPANHARTAVFDPAAEYARITAKPAPVARERSVQVTLKRHLEAVIPGCEVVAIKNEAQPRSEDPRARARFHDARKATGVKVGAPDLMILLSEQVFFVEVKRPGGVLSDAQLALHARWRAKRHIVIVADSIESLRLGLHQAGIRTIEHGGDMRAPNVRGLAKRPAAFTQDRLPI